jgi:hypothetical protein
MRRRPTRKYGMKVRPDGNVKEKIVIVRDMLSIDGQSGYMNIHWLRPYQVDGTTSTQWWNTYYDTDNF